MTSYIPQPIDTSHVRLTEAQRRLIEQLASNDHDVWAKKRMDDGWRHGDSRNDDAKTHPCLIPYAQLPETEKDYDRVMVEQVVRGAVALGYRIEPRSA
jgi:hypothetical protein